jgi:PRC-barrel domain
MLRSRLAAAIVALAVTACPVAAQQAPSAENGPGVRADAALVGLPVYSSDGQRLAQISEVGSAGARRAVRVEMEESLGIGSRNVIIFADAFQQKNDRIELSMTAAEVKDTLSKQKLEQGQQEKNSEQK